MLQSETRIHLEHCSQVVTVLLFNLPPILSSQGYKDAGNQIRRGLKT